MFCPKCGKDNPEGTTCCKECGAPLVQAPSSPKPGYRYSPDPTRIILGLTLIAAMYLVPVVPHNSTKLVTLAEYASICSNLLQCTDQLVWWFYAGWVAALFFIIMGLLYKKEK